MNIVNDYPPNIDKIRSAFPIRDNTVFTYGNTIYAPKVRFMMPLDLIEHESVHMAQQGADPEAWWDRYISDADFRFNQELEAYRAQYRYYCRHVKGRNVQFNFLVTIARDLSGPLYGNMVDFIKATALIKS